MQLQLTVSSMACEACAKTIAEAIRSVDAAAVVEADPATKQVVVTTDSSEVAVRGAVEAAGYPVS